MSRTVLVALSALLILAACKKTDVEIRIRGAAALVEQGGTNAPVAVIFPKIGCTEIGSYPHMPEHIPYVAWLPEEEDSAPSPPATLIEDPVEHSKWHYHRLDREELVLMNDIMDNPLISPPPVDANCTAQQQKGTLGCIPQATAFLQTPDHPYKAGWVSRESPSQDISGRFEISRGTLSTFLGDSCKWMITPEGGAAPIQRDMATSVIYNFQIHGKTLNLGLRKLDRPYGKSRLVQLKPNDLGVINIRIGNAVSVFPPKTAEIPQGQIDEHFAFYYKFLEGVPSGPLPKRTSVCSGPFDEVVYCGPGWVKGKGTN